MYDILIKNGTVVDGTGSKPYKKNIARKDVLRRRYSRSKQSY